MARKPKLDDLYAAVYASPDDDAPRSVLADALQEAGDPRGEFIALQLARAKGGKKTWRESQLLKPNLRNWLGPLVMCIPNKKLVFERGFVARCQLQHHRESFEPYAHHPEWATVVEVTPGAWKGSMQILADAMIALRTLNTEARAEVLPSHPKLEKIAITLVLEGEVEHLATLQLPSLQELAIEHCHPTLKTMKPVLDNLPALRRLSVNVDDAEAWIPWLAKGGFERAGVRSTMNPWMLWFEGDRVTAQYRYSGHPQPRAASQLASYLGHVPTPNKRHLTVNQAFSWHGTTIADVAHGAAAALKRFASHEIVAE